MTPAQERLLVASLLVVSVLGALDHTIVATSLATIAAEVGGFEHMSWIIVAYTLAGTVVLPVFGKLADVVGARAVFLGSLALFVVASLACGFAQDIVQLTGARVIQGLSSAGLMLMPQTIVGVSVPARRRPQVLSIIGAAFPVAILAGPLLGGVITDVWGWRWVFWINVPVGVVALALSFFAIPRIESRPAGRFDGWGTGLLVVWVSALVVAVSGTGAADPRVVPVAVTVAVLGLVAFLLVERRAEEPLMPLHHFRDRTVLLCVVLTTVIGVGLFAVVSYVPTYVQMVYLVSPTISGVVPITTVFGMLVATLFTGWLASRTGRYRLFPVVGSSLAAVGMFAMSALPAGAPIWMPAGLMAMVGVGTGAFMNVIIAAAQSAVPRGEIGAVTATFNLVRQVGSSAATAIIGALIGGTVLAGLPAGLQASQLTPAAVAELTASQQANVSQLYLEALAPIFAALGVVYCVGIVAGLSLPNRPLLDEVAHEPAAAR